MAITRFSSNVLTALFLVGMLAIVGSIMGIQSSFSILSNNKTVSSSGAVEYSSVKILTSFMEDWFFNESRPIEVATKFDVVITWCGDFIPQMRNANPDLILLRYMPIGAVYSDGWGWNESLAGGWLLKDIYGTYIRSTIWQTLYLVNPNAPGYRSWLATYCKQILDQYGYEGIFADGASAVTRPLWDLSGDPVNPDTGKVYTDHEWVIALSGLNQLVKTTIAPKLLIGNGCLRGGGPIGGWTHLDDYQLLLQNMDGAMIETSIFASWEGNRSQQDWIQDVSFIKWHTSRNKYSLIWSAVDNGQQAQSLSLYCLTSYLLGMGDFHFASVSVTNTMETPYVQKLLNVTLGTSLEEFHNRTDNPNIFERDFSNSKVMVNPSGVSYEISLMGSYANLDGQIVTQVSLPSHTGTILLNTH